MSGSKKDAGRRVTASVFVVAGPDVVRSGEECAECAAEEERECDRDDAGDVFVDEMRMEPGMVVVVVVVTGEMMAVGGETMEIAKGARPFKGNFCVM